MTALQITGYVLKLLLPWALELGTKLLEGAPPPTVEELTKLAETSLQRKHQDWIAHEKRAADAVREQAVRDAFERGI